MATLEQLSAALIKADAAGNAADAKILADAIRQMKAGQSSAPVTDPGPGYKTEGAAIVPVNPMAADPMPAQAPSNPAGGMVEQGLSGVNEGIARGVGMLPDAANDFLVKPAIGAINAVAGTDIKPSEKPFLGTAMMMDVLAPTIRPPSDNPAEQFARRIGQDVGAGAVMGGPLAGMTAAPVKTFAADMLSSLGSGTGAAVANAVAPGNPVAEIAGSLVGGFTPAGIASGLRRALSSTKAPTLEALQNMKSAAYKAADTAGVSYTPAGLQQMTADIGAAVAKDNISAIRHPKAASLVADLPGMVAKGMSLTELDQLRQVVRRDLIRSSDEAEQHFGGIILDQIDAFIAKAAGPQVATGTGAKGAELITTARELNTRWRKTELLQDSIYAAGLRAASSGTGGNLENATRQAFKSILLNDSKRAAFTADEIAEMEKVVNGSKGQDVLRLLGRLSPSANGLSAFAGLVAASSGYGVVPAVGLGAKMLADNATVGRAARLRDNVARGGPAPKAPELSEADKAAAVNTAGVTAANQNGTEGSILSWLVRNGQQDIAQQLRAGEITPQVAYQQAMQRRMAAGQ